MTDNYLVNLFIITHAHTLSLTLARTHTHSLTHTHTHTHSLTRTHSLSHTLTLALAFAFTLATLVSLLRRNQKCVLIRSIYYILNIAQSKMNGHYNTFTTRGKYLLSLYLWAIPHQLRDLPKFRNAPLLRSRKGIP